jgi:hypothetical protein
MTTFYILNWKQLIGLGKFWEFEPFLNSLYWIGAETYNLLQFVFWVWVWSNYKSLVFDLGKLVIGSLNMFFQQKINTNAKWKFQCLNMNLVIVF